MDPENSNFPADKKSTDPSTTTTVPFVVVNLAIDDLWLCKKEILGFLEQSELKVSEIIRETVYEASLINEGFYSDEICQHSDGEEKADEKKFITSPVYIDMHHNVELENVDIEKQYKEQFKELCKKFTDILSKDASDIGKTKLITLDIDNDDNSPIYQRPYNLPLKHASWVWKELELFKNLE